MRLVVFTAIRSIRLQKQGTVEKFRDEPSQTVLGKLEWKVLIENAFSGNRFFLTAQPVISGAGEFHREVFANMIDQEGVKHRAGFFIPMVKALGLESRLDQYVLEQSAGFLAESSEGGLAVNITTDFCRDRLAIPWFRKFLLDQKEVLT